MKFRLHLIVLSLALGILPGLAQALGLGELTVRSHLYEPLDADIELLSVGDLGESEILANLAGAEEFSRAGIQRFYHLVQLRFQVARNDAGRLVVRLSTEKPVTEPFLNFLTEVHWPKGRLMREYTILLDPVTYARIMPELVEEPVAQKVEAPAPAPAKTASAPKPRQPAPTVSREVAPARSVAATTEQKKKDLKSTSPEAEPAKETAASEPKEYGPVKSGDTLWAIARSQRPAGVSVHSAMLAIQRVNPDAFINNNINLLKRGAVLRIPTLEEIEGIGETEAKSEVARQEEVWRVRREPEAATTEDASGKAVEAPADGALRLVTASADAGSSANVASEEDAAKLEQLRDKLASSKEQLDEAHREGDELRGKVGQLEEQIETLSRLIELKNEQLANLQKQATGEMDAPMDSAAADDMTDDGMMAESGLPEAVLDSDTDAASMDAASSEMAGTESDADGMEAASDDLMIEEQAAADDLMGEGAGDDLLAEEEPATEMDDDAGAAAPVPAPAPVAVAPEPIPEPQPEAGLIDRVMANPMLLGAVGGGVILLLLGGMFVARRRGSQADEADLEDEGDALGLGDDQLSLDGDELGSLDLGDDSGAAEGASTDDDLGGLDLGSLDEAMAELEPEPEPEPEPEEDVPSLDDLGMELAADIAGGDSSAADTSELEAELDAALGELELEDAGTGAAEVSLELDDSGLGDLELEEAAPADDGLGELELDDGGLGDLELEEAATADDGLGELELDDAGLDEVSLELPADDGLGELELDDSGLGDVELEAPGDDGLGELELDDTGLEELALDTPADDGLGELELDDGGLDDVSLEEIGAEAAAAPAADIGGELSVDDDLGDDLQFESADEVATKLDLARAYIEMGDAEGAREILDEVLVEGDDGQKSEAQQLIDQL